MVILASKWYKVVIGGKGIFEAKQKAGLKKKN